MVEREPIIDKERITYEGLFSFAELIKLLQDWMSTKGYVPIEKSAVETIKQDGKYVEYWFAPFKKVTDYAKNLLWIRIIGTGLKEKEVEKDNKKVMLVEGKIQIVLDAFLETDWEGRWEAKPLFYVLRTVWEKYVYKPFLSGFQENIKKDATDLKNQMKAFLNLYKY